VIANEARSEQLTPGRRLGGLSRRRFVRGVGVAAVGAWLLPAIADSSISAQAATVDPLSTLSQARWSSHIGENFHVTGPSMGVDLRLVKVESHSFKNVKPQAGESFSLIFDGPSTTHLKQATYQFQNTTLGILSLFIVPDAPAGQAPKYVAVINRRG
jgi:hypothetical protein